MTFNGQQTEGNSRKNTNAVMIGITAAVVIVFLGMAGIIPFFMARNMINRAVEQDTSKYNVSVTAVISEYTLKEKTDGDGNVKIYTPVYEYEYNGNKYRVTGGVSSTEKKYQVGQEVNVRISDENPGKLYDPSLNRNAIFEEAGASGFLPMLILIPIFILAAMIGIVVIITIRIARKTASGNNIPQDSEENSFDPDDDYRG